MQMRGIFENQLPKDKKITAVKPSAWLDEKTLTPMYSVEIKFKDTKFGHLLRDDGVVFFQTEEEAKTYGTELKKKHNALVA